MKTIHLEIPDVTYDRLDAVAKFENKTLDHFIKEILILAEKEIWKIKGLKTKEMLKGLDYFNEHLR